MQLPAPVASGATVDAVPALFMPLPTRAEQAARRSPQARAAAVDAGVAALKAPSSWWPVDTGRSKRAWRRIGTGNSSRIYNPLHYASYAEDQSNQAARRTLNAAEPKLVRAARLATGPETSRQERSALHLLEIRRAGAARERLEDAEGVYQLYADVFTAAGSRRGPLIPASIRLIDRLIRRRASRAR